MSGRGPERNRTAKCILTLGPRVPYVPLAPSAETLQLIAIAQRERVLYNERMDARAAAQPEIVRSRSRVKTGGIMGLVRVVDR